MKVKAIRSALAILLAFIPVSAQAGQAESGLLASYIGSWQGEGSLVGGEAPEPFRCRLNITKGKQSKINYAGRCSLIDMNLSVSGTIAFNDGTDRYEAAMSSNAGFTGTAIGIQKGDRISFDLEEKQLDRAGNDVRIGARIELIGDHVSVDFQVEFNNSGQVLTALVPFAK